MEVYFQVNSSPYSLKLISLGQLFNNPSHFPNPPYMSGILVVINMRLESTFQLAAFTTPASSEIAFCSCLLMSFSLATQLMAV